MNPEQTIAAALREAASAVEPRPTGYEAIRAGIERRRRRARTLVPLTAAAAVLVLVAGIVAVGRVRDDAPVQPARTPADLYLENGSVWPLDSKSEARQWRRDPGSAPYLRTPQGAAAEFLRRFHGVPAERVRLMTVSRDVVVLVVNGPPLAEVYVQREPGSDGPWVVSEVGLPGIDGYPDKWFTTRNRVLRSGDPIRTVPVTDETRVEVRELTPAGDYRVLGSDRLVGMGTPDGRWSPEVAFREPSRAFGVIAVEAYRGGRLQRFYLRPTSFGPSWPLRPPPASPRSSGYFEESPVGIRDGAVVAQGGSGNGEILSTGRAAGVVAVAVDGTGQRSFSLLRRTGPCRGRVEEGLVVRDAATRTVAEVDGVPVAVARSGATVAYTTTTCDGRGASVHVLDDGRTTTVGRVAEGSAVSPAVDPVARRVAFVRRTSRASDVVVVDLAGGAAERTLRPIEDGCDWGAVTFRVRDGRTTLVTAQLCGDDRGLRLVEYDADGGRPRDLAADVLPTYEVVSLDYEPSGEALLLATRDLLIRGGDDQLWLISWPDTGWSGQVTW